MTGTGGDQVSAERLAVAGPLLLQAVQAAAEELRVACHRIHDTGPATWTAEGNVQGWAAVIGEMYRVATRSADLVDLVRERVKDLEQVEGVRLATIRGDVQVPAAQWVDAAAIGLACAEGRVRGGAEWLNRSWTALAALRAVPVEDPPG